MCQASGRTFQILFHLIGNSLERPWYFHYHYGDHVLKPREEKRLSSLPLKGSVKVSEMLRRSVWVVDVYSAKEKGWNGLEEKWVKGAVCSRSWPLTLGVGVGPYHVNKAVDCSFLQPEAAGCPSPGQSCAEWKEGDKGDPQTFGSNVTQFLWVVSTHLCRSASDLEGEVQDFNGQKSQ